jgi:hypothetical protein
MTHRGWTDRPPTGSIWHFGSANGCEKAFCIRVVAINSKIWLIETGGWGKQFEVKEPWNSFMMHWPINE